MVGAVMNLKNLFYRLTIETDEAQFAMIPSCIRVASYPNSTRSKRGTVSL